MGCLFSKTYTLLQTSEPELGLHVTLFESNINYSNPIHSQSKLEKRYTI